MSTYKPVFVGHSDCSPLSKEETNLGRSCSGRHFRTIKDAEFFVAGLSLDHRFSQKVFDGVYCIDASEKLRHLENKKGR
jgi:hypothetical protein